MKKRVAKIALVWLLVVCQLLMPCTGFAESETTTNGTTQIETENGMETQVQTKVFSVMMYAGNYTVNFYATTADQVTAETEPLYTVTGVDSGTIIDDLCAQMVSTYPQYEDTVWSVTGEYRVLNNVNVFMQPESMVAQLGNTYYPTLQAAIEVVGTDAALGNTTVYLLKDTTESVSFSDKSFTLDMGGHTLTAAEGTRAYTQNGGDVTVLQGTITGGNISDDGGGMYVGSGKLTAEYVNLLNNIVTGSSSWGAGLYALRSTVTLRYCKFEGNQADRFGGAVYHNGGDKLTMDHCQILQNKAQGDAGVAAYGNAADITSCDFEGNIGGNLRASALSIWETGSATNCNFINNSGATSVVSCKNATLSNCEITGNKNIYGAPVAAEGSYWSTANLSLNHCTIANNQSNGGTDSGEAIGAGGIYASNASVTLENGTSVYSNTCPVSGGIYVTEQSTVTIKGKSSVYNNVGNECGGIFVNNYASVILTGGSSVYGNEGNECGGIYVGSGWAYSKISINEGTAVYDNKMGSGPNDLRIAAGQSVTTVPAAQMEHGDKKFDEYTWVEVDPIAGGALKSVITPETWTDYDRFYAAVPFASRPVAELWRDGNKIGDGYLTIAAAMEDAQDGDVVRLIDEEQVEGLTEPLNMPVYESVTINKNVTLDLNCRTLSALNGSAITVNAGSTLTLVDEQCANNPPSYTECSTLAVNAPAIKNEGTLIIDSGVKVSWVCNHGFLTIQGNAEVGRAEQQSDAQAMILNTTEKIDTIYLDAEDNPVTAGSSFKFDTLTFELNSNVLRKLNNGSEDVSNPVIVTLMKPDEGVTLPEHALSATVSGANGYVTLSIMDGKLIASAEPLNGVYVDGQNGVDDGEEGVVRGLTPDKPVKTFAKAKEILEGLLAARSVSPDDVKGIYVMGALNVDGTESWELPEGKQLMRYPDYLGVMINVKANGNLTLEEITVDGGSGYGVVASDEIISVSDTGTLVITGAALQNNNNRYGFGGAVYANGNVTMSGGSITGNEAWYGGGICMNYNGSLVMSGGTISSNTAIGNSKATGGGVALLRSAHMTLCGGTISGNTSGGDGYDGIGGGIGVGGVTDDIVGNARLSMTSGTVSGNTAQEEGGGIYVQAQATATISGGKITGNHSLGGFFGGGGIYVNGTRQVNGKEYLNGRLYLTNVIIKGNTAGDFGGGLAGCNTSDNEIYVTSGGAIYQNAANSASQLYIEPLYLSGFTCGSISAYMLGGGEYNWLNSSGESAKLDILCNVTRSMSVALNNAPTADAIGAAEAKGGVWITGNTAVTRGGGIGSNGFVQIGIPPTDGEWMPEVTKTLTGRDMVEGEFTFIVTENGQKVSTGKNEASEDGEPARIIFDPIEYTSEDSPIGTKHTYIITEEIGNASGMDYDQTSYTVNVTVIEGKDGKLTGYVTDITVGDETAAEKVAFTNRYTPEKIDTQLSVSKTVIGQPHATEENFIFELTMAPNQKDENYVTMNQPTKVVAQNKGTAQFGKIEFAKAGEYVFIIKEIDGHVTGYKYDSSEWKATVKVTDENAVLKVESVTYAKDDTESNNIGPSRKIRLLLIHPCARAGFPWLCAQQASACQA